MSEIRKRIEEGFESFGRMIYENRKKTLVIMVLLIVALVSGVRHTRFDTSNEAFLHDDDPILIAGEKIQKPKNVSADLVVMGVEDEDPGTTIGNRRKSFGV